MRNLKLLVRYDGTDFGGWQTQPNVRTVQAVLEQAIQSVTQDKRIRCNASGRTDAGVHALGQVVNFFSTTSLENSVLVKAINARLPADVQVLACEDVPHAFCANKDAVTKCYRYVINDGRLPDIFLRRYAWQPRRILNAEIMHEAAQALRGRHDFRSFETDWPNRLSSIRTITEIIVERDGPVIRLEVEADGFLYNMVRAIAGTLYQVGRGYWTADQVRQILETKDRRTAGPTAPPQGLFLLRVNYG